MSLKKNAVVVDDTGATGSPVKNELSEITDERDDRTLVMDSALTEPGKKYAVSDTARPKSSARARQAEDTEEDEEGDGKKEDDHEDEDQQDAIEAVIQETVESEIDSRQSTGFDSESAAQGGGTTNRRKKASSAAAESFAELASSLAARARSAC